MVASRRLPIAAAIMFAATPALAHHPLGGLPMQSFSDGLLSGVGHPLLGFDHLLFVALVGIAALLTGRALLAPAAYIVAMLLGCLATAAGATPPLAELAVGASLLVLGGVVLSGRAMSAPAAMALFFGFGLFHGAAFGESILGQEGGAGGGVVAGYLLGLAAVQYALAVSTGAVARSLFNVTTASAINARLSGGIVAGAGLLLTLETVEGLVFDALGWLA